MITTASRPTVTLRSTCYNHAAFVVESLDSVARQNFDDFQWIIVDDASTDDSARLILRWLDQHRKALGRRGVQVEFVRHQTNTGFVRTLNEVLELAAGTYLCGLSCDDRMLPYRIAKSVQRLEQLPATYAGIYSDAYLIDSSGNRLEGRFINRYRQFERMPEGNLFESLLPGNFIPVPTVMVRTDALRRMGGYDESLPYVDYDLWLRLSRRYKFAFIDSPLSEYRLHDKNLHTRIPDWDIANYWIYRKHVDDAQGAKRYVEHARHLGSQGRLWHKVLVDIHNAHVPQLPNWNEQRAFLLGEGRRQIDIPPKPLKIKPLLRRFAKRILLRKTCREFQFIHINKTGGCSIEQALNIPTVHKTALEKIAELGRQRWEEMFTFAVVRNPWDKVVSQYHYRRQRDKTGLATRDIDFAQWVRLTLDEKNRLYYDDPRLFMPQLQWLVDSENRLAVKFIGRFERIGFDFHKICRKLGRKAALPHVNRSQRGSYRQYYDRQSREIVAEVYKDDIETFGYRY